MRPRRADHPTPDGTGAGVLVRVRAWPGLGEIELVASSLGLCGVSFRTWGDAWREPQTPTGGPRACAPEEPQTQQAILDQAEAHLATLLGSGSHTPPPPRLDLRGVTAFTRRVLEVTQRIPRGSTWSYGQLARELGRPGGARAVGQALGRNPLPILIPCHRVVGHAGLGGFTPGVVIKRRLLAIEGYALSPAPVA